MARVDHGEDAQDTGMTETEVNVDWNAVERKLMDRGKRALNATLDWTVDQAQKYAPVRSSFEATNEKRRFHEQTGLRGRMGPAFQRGGRADTAQEMDAFMTQFHRGRQREKQVIVITSFDKGQRSVGGVKTVAGVKKGGVGEGPGESRTRRYGRANSFSPIFSEGLETHTALDTYRNIERQAGNQSKPQKYLDSEGRQTYRLDTAVELTGKTGSPLQATPTAWGGFVLASGERRLSQRGRFELRHAAAVEVKEREVSLFRSTGQHALANQLAKSFRPSAVFRSASGGITLGGRLRGEIHRTQVVEDAGEIWGEVVSPTPYATYQEYGTAHNRAHPYMRPALYDARPVLHRNLKRAMEEG